MKRLIIIFFLIIGASFSFAQYFEGGIISGVSANQIDGDTYSGYNKLGYNFNVFALVHLHKNISLQSGVTIIQKGAHSPPKSLFFRTVVNEVEVPFWINIEPYEHLSGTIGLNFGYIYKAYYESTTVYTKQDLGIGNTDWSYYIGLGYKLSPKIKFRLGHRYSLIPITRPIKFQCWQKSIFLSWLLPNVYTTTPCWWTNTITVSFEFKIF